MKRNLKAKSNVITDERQKTGLDDVVTFIRSQPSPTKRVKFDVSSVPDDTDVTLTVPGSTGTLVGRDTTDTLTNKTLITPVIASIKPSASYTHTVPDVASDTVTLNAAAQTLTNKTVALASNNITTTYYASLIGAAAQNVTSGAAAVKRTMTTLSADPSTVMTDAANSRVLAPFAGLYNMEAILYINTPVAGVYYFSFYKNGSELRRFYKSFAATTAESVAFSYTAALATNDYIEVYMWQNTGSTVSIGNITTTYGRRLNMNLVHKV